jgi:class 3 adenylate cyclase
MNMEWGYYMPHKAGIVTSDLPLWPMASSQREITINDHDKSQPDGPEAEKLPDRNTPLIRIPMSLAYRFVAAVDIEGFSKLTVREQIRAQNDLSRALHVAALRAGLDRDEWYLQPSGDGELAVLPSDTDALRLVAHYPEELGHALAEINRERHPDPRLRIRVALHHGTLVEGTLGPAGQTPIVVSRLLDSDLLRGELARHQDRDLVLAVSASVYEDVIATRLGDLNPAAFRPHRITAKNTELDLWIHCDCRADDRTSSEVPPPTALPNRHLPDPALWTRTAG